MLYLKFKYIDKIYYFRIILYLLPTQLDSILLSQNWGLFLKMIHSIIIEELYYKYKKMIFI
jgi:hypothetical protein